MRVGTPPKEILAVPSGALVHDFFENFKMQPDVARLEARNTKCFGSMWKIDPWWTIDTCKSRAEVIGCSCDDHGSYDDVIELSIA